MAGSNIARSPTQLGVGGFGGRYHRQLEPSTGDQFLSFFNSNQVNMVESI